MAVVNSLAFVLSIANSLWGGIEMALERMMLLITSRPRAAGHRSTPGSGVGSSVGADGSGRRIVRDAMRLDCDCALDETMTMRWIASAGALVR